MKKKTLGTKRPRRNRRKEAQAEARAYKLMLVGFILAIIIAWLMTKVLNWQADAKAITSPESKVVVVEKEVIKTLEVPITLTQTLSEKEVVKTWIREIWGKDAHIGLALAECESGFRAEAANPKSSARGIYQFIRATWIAERKRMGRNPALDLRFDARENILTGYNHFKRNGIYQPWAESVACVRAKGVNI